MAPAASSAAGSSLSAEEQRLRIVALRDGAVAAEAETIAGLSLGIRESVAELKGKWDSERAAFGDLLSRTRQLLDATASSFALNADLNAKVLEHAARLEALREAEVAGGPVPPRRAGSGDGDGVTRVVDVPDDFVVSVLGRLDSHTAVAAACLVCRKFRDAAGRDGGELWRALCARDWNLAPGSVGRGRGGPAPDPGRVATLEDGLGLMDYFEDEVWDEVLERLKDDADVLWDGDRTGAGPGGWKAVYRDRWVGWRRGVSVVKWLRAQHFPEDVNGRNQRFHILACVKYLGMYTSCLRSEAECGEEEQRRAAALGLDLGARIRVGNARRAEIIEAGGLAAFCALLTNQSKMVAEMAAGLLGNLAYGDQAAKEELLFRLKAEARLFALLNVGSPRARGEAARALVTLRCGLGPGRIYLPGYPVEGLPGMPPEVAPREAVSDAVGDAVGDAGATSGAAVPPGVVQGSVDLPWTLVEYFAEGGSQGDALGGAVSGSSNVSAAHELVIHLSMGTGEPIPVHGFGHDKDYDFMIEGQVSLAKGTITLTKRYHGSLAASGITYEGFLDRRGMYGWSRPLRAGGNVFQISTERGARPFRLWCDVATERGPVSD